MNFSKKNHEHQSTIETKMSKTILTILVTLLFTLTSIAQQGINYKALIKDNLGNVLVNHNIAVQFQILQGAGMTNVYQENHPTATDDNGIVILNIGEGIPISGTFNSIDWSSDDHFLNVQINTGSGLSDMGTTQFMAVPYAKQAENALVAANVTGLEALDEGNGMGWRLKGRDPANYGNIGENAVDFSEATEPSITRGATGNRATAMGFSTNASGYTSTAMGYSTYATGSYATAMGLSSRASGIHATAMGAFALASGSDATAMGSFAIASGLVSTAMGSNTRALGDYSTAMGYSTDALGDYSTAMGENTKAESSYSTAIGRYNIGGGSPVSWEATDPLFEIGNGSSDASRANALTVLKNGNVGIDTPNPTVKLHITGGSDAGLNQTGGYIVNGETTGMHMVIDNNEIMVKQNNIGQTLYLNHGGGDVSVGGSVVHSSDRRLKKDIETIPYGLDDILKLQPKAYNWKNRDQTTKSLGLIAQDVQPIINNVVQINDDADKTLSISYTELIPVLIKAIQEQQDIIESQNKNYEKLLKRVEQLEFASNK